MFAIVSSVLLIVFVLLACFIVTRDAQLLEGLGLAGAAGVSLRRFMTVTVTSVLTKFAAVAPACWVRIQPRHSGTGTIDLMGAYLVQCERAKPSLGSYLRLSGGLWAS